jgi:hypothetical protein
MPGSNCAVLYDSWLLGVPQGDLYDLEALPIAHILALDTEPSLPYSLGCKSFWMQL